MTATTQGRRYALLPFHRQVPLLRLIHHPGRVTLCWLARTLRPPRHRTAEPIHRWTIVDGRVVSAVVDDDVTPLAAHQRNLHLVTAALTRAGVDHFVIPASSGLRSRVGVPDSARAAALQALDATAGLLFAPPTPVRPDQTYPVRGPRPRPRLSRRWRRAPVLRAFQPVTGSSGELAYGATTACDIEFWSTQEGGQLRAPRPNECARVVPADPAPVRVAESDVTAFAPDDPIAPHLTRPAFARRSARWPNFPVDLVCCWTDTTDPRWRLRRQRALAGSAGSAGPASAAVPGPERSRAARHRPTPPTVPAIGWTSTEELRHLLRSVHLHAPWIRRIFLVTAGQVPTWLDVEHPRLTVVDHRDLLDGRAVAPTFNPYAIESTLHDIDGLAERFLYLPDGVFFGRPVTRETFFHANGVPKLVLTDDAAPVTEVCRQVILDQFDRTVDAPAPTDLPLPLRRCTLAEICASVPDLVDRIRCHQFAQPDDVSLVRTLHHPWSFLRGTGVPGELRRLTANLADRATPLRLHRLLDERDHDAFRLVHPEPRVSQLADDFLTRYLPVRSPYEVAEEVAATRAPFTATELAQRLLRPPVGRFPAGPLVRLVPAELGPAEPAPTELVPAELAPAELAPAELAPAELAPAAEVPHQETRYPDWREPDLSRPEALAGRRCG
ncbi:hypothetical protein O7632_27925 [Solwaraspora sp. WMMD406]|uniref:hypothetical protein n=1 Tax=Solwaraspora sp. WMMD406 TaxID=3016095 RepID=UPI0024162B76|nr:hypothetical protein [Solwaraspora sp. WMMD406]MDG4767894.1 hypothetical protein [Solwaraspora sp. WMMD406]